MCFAAKGFVRQCVAFKLHIREGIDALCARHRCHVACLWGTWLVSLRGWCFEGIAVAVKRLFARSSQSGFQNDSAHPCLVLRAAKLVLKHVFRSWKGLWSVRACVCVCVSQRVCMRVVLSCPALTTMHKFTCSCPAASAVSQMSCYRFREALMYVIRRLSMINVSNVYEPRQPSQQ